ncbi:hypothetical protein K474DRAFT_1674735 [Panus rudis PR-1116 ss-1]|nr:hypothetical protein K474DRAFT_1674735 [Panus rudis PR-1116 ss-1]
MPRTRTAPTLPPQERSVKEPVPSAQGPTKKPSVIDRLPLTATLPTPPRTKKRKRARSRVTDSSSEDEDELPVLSDQEDRKPSVKDDAVLLGHKKRRTLQLDAIAEELSQKAAEDAFWMGDSSTSLFPIASKSTKPKETQAERGRSGTRSPTRSPSSSPPPHLLRRNRTGLFSPPPSRRQPTLIRPPVTPPPQTPKKQKNVKPKGGTSKMLVPERDSPNNPFLLDSSPGSDDQELPKTPRTPQRHIEKPTITMVFRGVKTEYPNPLYDPTQPDGVPPPIPNSPSNLPPSDPDFSPTPYCPPKLLFPESRKRDHARYRRKASLEVQSDPGSDVKDKRAGSSSAASGAKRSGKGKAKAKAHSEWDTSDEEDERPRKPEVVPRRSPRLRSRYADVSGEPGTSGRVDKARPNVKELAKIAPVFFGAD